MRKKLIVLSISIASLLCIGCSNINKFTDNISKNLNKKVENKDEVKTEVDGIKFIVKDFSIKNDYENKKCAVFDIEYENISNERKQLDYLDINVYQDNYKLKNIHDESLQTNAYYKTLEPKEIKRYTVAYKLEGDKDLKLIFTPYLSKEKLKLEFSIKK